VLRRIARAVRAAVADRRLPSAAREEALRDQREGLYSDPGIDAAVGAATRWLCVAQDRSRSNDGGVARHFSLISGWATSYPETTGYIVPTMFERATATHDAELEARAVRMLDWLLSVQMRGGGFPGGVIGATPVSATTFNTGQILMGLAAGAARLGGRYATAMAEAANWLVESQDADGCWRRNASPFALSGDKVYDTHVAWGLLEAARADSNNDRYAASALRNVDWALGKQQPNGWFADNCLDDPSRPLTHTIGYAMRGVMEAYLYTREPRYLASVQRSAEGALSALRPDGALPGRLDSSWTPAVQWVCLTGEVQIAHCWLLLYRETGDTRLRDAAYRANAFVRRTIRMQGDPNVVGAVKGSFPVSGGYGRFEYLNWAAKFFIDSNVLEAATRARESASR
jgi:hypothetical protein